MNICGIIANGTLATYDPSNFYPRAPSHDQPLTNNLSREGLNYLIGNRNPGMA